MQKPGNKKFIPYPKRSITLSPATWEKLKTQKLKNGKNWETFIKELLTNLK